MLHRRRGFAAPTTTIVERETQGRRQLDTRAKRVCPVFPARNAQHFERMSSDAGPMVRRITTEEVTADGWQT